MRGVGLMGVLVYEGSGDGELTSPGAMWPTCN